MSRFWLVETHDDLESLKTTRGGVFAQLLCVNGVLSVTDLDAISRGTLDAMLLPPEKTWEYVKRKVTRPHRNGTT